VNILYIYSISLAAARALKDIPELSAEEVARRSMEIASDMCVYTNKSFMVEVLDEKKPEEEESKEKND
jgi:ATP-dependent HslUV protease subunit HslV